MSVRVQFAYVVVVVMVVIVDVLVKIIANIC